MKRKKVKYTNERLGKLRIVEDFLPKPEDLVLREETAKVTISLTRSSINFFKHEAEKYHTNYQTMIRALLDKYALRFA